MGEVYEAHEVNLQRRVALKVIAPTNPDEHDREELIRRFLQEARTLARVNHPNIVTIYAIDSVGDVPFIAMEYIDGVSFKELLKEFVLTSEAAAPLFEQMLEGVRCLHENRIIHRDLKPHNILLRPDGQIKILDFGIAKHATAGDYTQVGVVVGTLPYMAPELKSGIPASQQSDFWSLGAIFYECLTGTPLTLALRDSGQTREIPYPEGSVIPPEMRAIIAKMCAHKPSDRFASAVQAIEELKRFQTNRPQPTPEVWATLAQKITEIAETRKKKNSTGPIELPVSGKFPSSTPVPITGPISLPKIAPIDLALGHDPMATPHRSHSQSLSKKRKSKKLKALLGNEYFAAGVALALAVMVFILWPSPREKLPQHTLPPQPALPVQPPQTQTQVSPGVPGQTVFRPPSETLELKEPVNMQTLYLAPSAIPTLRWNLALTTDEYEIQIARDIAFKNLIVHEPVTGKSYRPARILPDGEYFWRLLPVDESKPPLDPARFNVVMLTPAELVQPNDGAVHEVRSKSATTSVSLQWNCKKYPATYRVQVAQTSDFRKPLVDQSITECDWPLSKIGAGEYFWRIRVNAKTRDQDLWSDTRKFTITAAHSDVPSLAKARLLVKAQEVTLAFRGSPRDPASAAANLTNPPKLEWQPVKGAHRYLVQFSPTKSFSPLLSEEVVKVPKFQWRNAQPGRIYWRVAALGPAGAQGPFSDPSQLDVKLPAPELDSTYHLVVSEDPAKPLAVQWNPVPFAAKYLVQIGKKRDLATAASKLTAQPEVKISGNVGHQFIRVATVDASGEVTSDFSKVASVDFEAVSNLAIPKLITPKIGMKVAVRGSKISVVFTWSPVSGASSYSIEIASDPEFQNILQSRRSKDTTLVVKQAEFNGTVYWRVRAKDEKGASAWSESGYFEVNN
jgi:serine/threonine protein kinase